MPEDATRKASIQPRVIRIAFQSLGPNHESNVFVSPRRKMSLFNEDSEQKTKQVEIQSLSEQISLLNKTLSALPTSIVRKK